MELREGNAFTIWLNASVLSSVWVELVMVINQKLVKFLADMQFCGQMGRYALFQGEYALFESR